MKLHIVIILILLATVSKSQQIIKLDTVKEFYTNGNLKCIGLMYKSNKIYNWTEYYENGKLKKANYYLIDTTSCGIIGIDSTYLKINYNNVLIDTIMFSYEKYNECVSKDSIVTVKIDCPYLELYEDGKTAKIIRKYNDNTHHYLIYNNAGKIVEDYIISNGNFHGIALFYDLNSKLEFIEYYNKGKIISRVKYNKGIVVDYINIK